MKVKKLLFVTLFCALLFAALSATAYADPTPPTYTCVCGGTKWNPVNITKAIHSAPGQVDWECDRCKKLITLTGYNPQVYLFDPNSGETNFQTHDWGTPANTPATCTVDGKNVYDCTFSACTNTATGKPWQKTDTIPALGHNLASTTVTKAAVAPTCTVDGLTDEITCDWCNTQVLQAQTAVPATGHNAASTLVTKPAVAPTCTVDGLTDEITCDWCNTQVLQAQTAVPAIGHNYSGVVTTNPTCTTQGVMSYTCANDASHTYTSPVVALGHSWGADKITKYPTCTSDGAKDQTCQRAGCGATQNVTVAAYGHKWDNGVVVKAPTYEADGSILYTCENDRSHTYYGILYKLVKILPQTGQLWWPGMALVVLGLGVVGFDVLRKRKHG